MSAMTAVPYNPYKPTTLTAGFGAYRDEYAVALGVYHYIKPDMLVNAGISTTHKGDTMARAGFSMAIGGKKSKYKQRTVENDMRAIGNGVQNNSIALQKAEYRANVAEAKISELKKSDLENKKIILALIERLDKQDKQLKELTKKISHTLEITPKRIKKLTKLSKKINKRR